MSNKSGQRRSPDAQMAAMRRLWPHFKGQKLQNGTLWWQGPLRPKGQIYVVSLFWHPTMSLPYVVVDNPPLTPREGGDFGEIPHLIFNADNPAQSGLCLFDPEGHEWLPSDLIAETTIYWTAEWLAYYELWHLSGEWLAPGVGYESVAQMRASEALIVRETLADVH